MSNVLGAVVHFDDLVRETRTALLDASMLGGMKERRWEMQNREVRGGRIPGRDACSSLIKTPSKQFLLCAAHHEIWSSRAANNLPEVGVVIGKSWRPWRCMEKEASEPPMALP